MALGFIDDNSLEGKFIHDIRVHLEAPVDIPKVVLVTIASYM